MRQSSWPRQTSTHCAGGSTQTNPKASTRSTLVARNSSLRDYPSNLGAKSMNFDRFERSIRFFGLEGQKELSRTRCAVVGVGGVGMHVIQQLTLFGVGGINPIDSEELAITDKNRNVA